ncbi:MAG: hypothetical protein ACHQQS_12180 [Thermoanaerobaculales bacterium]
MRQRSVAVGVATLLGTFALAFPPLARSAPPERTVGEKTITGPNVGPVIKPGVMLKDLRTLPPPRAGQGGKQGLPVRVPDWFLRPQGVPLTTPVTSGGVAPAIHVHALAPTGYQNFDGNTGGGPPDDNGAVGKLYYVQTTNLTLGIYDKGTGALKYSNSLANFFAAGNTGTSCDTEQRSDPVALYDAAVDRFIITDLSTVDDNVGPWTECLAVAKTSDPIAGGWNFYAVGSGNAGAGELTNRWLNDYPKLGVWPDGYYMMADMYDTVLCPVPGCQPGDIWHSSFKTVRVWAFDRTAMLAGNPMTPISFDVGGVYAMVPTNMTNPNGAPPAGRVNFFGAADYLTPPATSTKIHIYKFHSDFAIPANSTFTGPNDVTVPSYEAPTVAPPMPGSNMVLDTLGPRLMYQFQYRNFGGTESLWGLHTVNGPNNFCVTRWYQFDVTGGVIAAAPVQSGTTANGDSSHRWLGHLATDQFGNMALEYSDSSSSVGFEPGVRYNGRLVTDGAGTLGSEATLFTGPGVFASCTPNPGETTCGARWGDYSSVEVDPVDDCTFWFTNEYIDSGGNSATRIGSARFLPACTVNVQITKTHSPDPVLANGILTWDLHVTNGGPVGAYAVTVTDDVTVFASITPPTGWSCTTPAVGSGGFVTCTGVLPVGPGVHIYIGVTAPNVITILHNSTSVTTGSTNTALAINTTDVTDSASVVSPSDVTGTKTILTYASLLYPNFPVQFQVVLTNNSNYDQFDGTGDEFVDPLPATLTLNSATASSGAITTGANTVHWNGAIPAHTSVTITINATINASTAPGTTVTNTGTIHYDINGDGTNAGTRTVSVSFLVLAFIPTLSIVGLLAMLAALIGLGVFYLKRRH